MISYPYNAPIILTDTIFVDYGGQVGSFSIAQRQAAYLVAEKQATKYIGTFLLPTTVTGTFNFDGRNWRIATDYGYVHEVLSVTILSKEVSCDTDCTLDEDSGCVFVWSDTFGYLDVRCACSCCNNCGNALWPYQFRIAYRAGLPTGTATQPDMLLALTMAAQITLNEMAYPSQNESAGDIGVTEFETIDYRERRMPMKRTIFGNSARANKIANLIDGAVQKCRPSLRI